MQAADVRLQALTKQYHQSRVVDAIDLAIEPGSMVAMLGPSGCGKSTCLRMIAGLVEPSSGEIFLNGRAITRVPVHRRNIGLLFQNYALFPHMTVADNVGFGLETRRVGRAERMRRVMEALDLVQLGAMAARMPAQLSGGQQQRVALARALVIEPSMLLLDEPLGALDKGLRESMQDEIRALQRRLGLTTIMVTHDQDEALTMADTVVVMRAGRLEQVGPPAAVYGTPANRFVAGFIGASNFLEGVTERRDGAVRMTTAGGVVLDLPGQPGLDGRTTVTVRPEAIRLDDDPTGATPGANAARAAVDQVTYRGFVSQYHLRLDGGERLMALQQNQTHTGAHAYPVGARVVARWDAASNHVLGPDNPA